MGVLVWMAVVGRFGGLAAGRAFCCSGLLRRRREVSGDIGKKRRTAGPAGPRVAASSWPWWRWASLGEGCVDFSDAGGVAGLDGVGESGVVDGRRVDAGAGVLELIEG